MFGISFSELLLIGLVALLVLGPERLPGAARTVAMGGFAVIVKLEGNADDVIALAGEQAGDN